MSTRTERGLDRLVNFSDATVAIAITILILPLVDLAGDIGGATFGEFAAEHSGAFVAFIVTFAVIGRFWVIHHRVFELVRDYSSPLIWANMLWLASIVFLPFAANAVSAQSSRDGSFDAVYIGTMFVTTAAMLLIDLELGRHPSLMAEGGADQIGLTRSISVLVTLVVAGVLAYLVPSVGMLWVLLLFAAPLVARVLRAAVPALRR
ncbi:putative membrane protein [Agromyces terreus]|uniref:Membrane protein n=1 Tax=Agromyces terreus TaxID=424795 RepID=A0A9X2H2D8_9MICO|nr:TMEM175 family protein [Agromyces terreus]MCP2371986.1 putative membrane protein [Agromyces terreus]